MAPNVPKLALIMFKGFHSGLRWETKGYKTYDADKDVLTHNHRYLLHNPYSTHLARVLFRKLNTKSKRIIGDCLSDIYNFAADNVHLCGHMEPKEFWAYAKNSWEWSAHFRDDDFWAFTYRLFHARALFLDTVPKAHLPKGHPLVDALDRFRDCFDELYYPDSVLSPKLSGTRSKEAAEDGEDGEDEIPPVRYTRREYFQYALASSEGDGKDRPKTITMEDSQNKELDPNDRKYTPRTEIPDEVAEDTTAFYNDLGFTNPRHGHKDAYQEIEEALKKAEEEDEQAKRLEAEATGLEDDLMMMDVDQQEDNVGDVGIGGLEL